MDKRLIIEFNIFIILVAQAESGLSQDVIMYDDFSDPESGWQTFTDETGSVFYKDGWLYLKDLTKLDNTTRSCFDRHFSDFVLDVDTKLVEGTDDNWHIVYYRMQDQNNGYGFAISSDGYYMMDKWIDGERMFFTGPTESDYIKIGREITNHIRIACTGNDLSFYVNDNLLGVTSDPSFEGGNICLAARSLSGSSTTISFDNFTIIGPT
jgi:hypothetical protein